MTTTGATAGAESVVVVVTLVLPPRSCDVEVTESAFAGSNDVKPITVAARISGSFMSTFLPSVVTALRANSDVPERTLVPMVLFA